MPGVKGFSPTNLKYMSYFYKLYAPLAANRQQVADDFKLLVPNSTLLILLFQFLNLFDR